MKDSFDDYIARVEKEDRKVQAKAERFFKKKEKARKKRKRTGR
ncbi:hypothetical protein SEA_GUILLAUME_64 [Gordonia phage Guillaume]|uniref:Uncharacterized protein n=1 Tax=Gordonia phage Guillaume TaxID=2510570 RepID=A0A411B1W4_9CAUD|nr:hypothetical protein SEA_GUILLAUME_64 [Gordonia phage Guillaume]